jgi:hypothetical protein
LAQTDSTSLAWVNRISALALIGQIALSWPLWSGVNRSFPQIPLWGAPGLPEVASSLPLAGIGLLLLLLLLWKPAARPIIRGVLVWFTLLALLDLNRLQPWLYCYLILWALSLLDSTEALKGQQWAIAAIYVWGGIWKCTPYFAEDNFTWFCQTFSWTKPLGQFPALGYVAAVLETLLGLGLLWARTRRPAQIVCWAFHGFILLVISPLGLNWNTVVLPWNLAMIALVWTVFRYPGAINLPRRLPAFFLTAWIWVAPLLATIGWAPLAMAWTMYSNTQPEWNLYVEQGLVCDQLKPIWSQYAYDRKSKLLLDDWAMNELHTPAFNSAFAMGKLGRHWCDCLEEQNNGGIFRLRVHPFKKDRVQIDTIRCAR